MSNHAIVIVTVSSVMLHALLGCCCHQYDELAAAKAATERCACAHESPTVPPGQGGPLPSNAECDAHRCIFYAGNNHAPGLSGGADSIGPRDNGTGVQWSDDFEHKREIRSIDAVARDATRLSRARVQIWLI